MRELRRGFRRLTIGLPSMHCILILSYSLKLRRRRGSRIRLCSSSKYQWASPGITPCSSSNSNSNSNVHSSSRTLSHPSRIRITAFTPQSLLRLGSQTRCKTQLNMEILLSIKPINKPCSINKAK